MATAGLLKRIGIIGGILMTCHAQADSAFQGFGSELDGYIRESAHRYQISEAMLRGLVKFEDGWWGNISPTGATGVGQFTQRTWNWLANSLEGYRIGMQPITSKNKQTHQDPRKNPRVNMLATGLYARWHVEQFKRRGIVPTDENLYLAHNIGLGGLYRALQGRSTSADIQKMKHNGMKPGMDVKTFLAYQTARYNRHKYLANQVNNVDIVYLSTQYADNLKTPTSQMKWIMPNDSLTSWILPSTTPGLTWINPTN